MRLIKKIHKWLSLLIGLQLLIWLFSGFYFNLMDPQKSSGNQYRQKITSAFTYQKTFIEPQQVLLAASPTVSMKIISLLSQPYYLLTHEKGLYPHFKNKVSLVDALTGDKVIVHKAMAVALAKSSYSGPGELVSITKLSPPLEDMPREQNKVWRINYSDKLNTSVYIDAGSARIVGHSNDDKRFADFFFMLHFMDYDVLGGKPGFNNTQIIIFALFTLFLALTGLIWTTELLLKGRYKLIGYTKK